MDAKIQVNCAVVIDPKTICYALRDVRNNQLVINLSFHESSIRKGQHMSDGSNPAPTSIPPEKKSGCLGFGVKALVFGCIGSLVLCGGFVTLILVLVFGAIKSSDVYKHSVETAKSSVELQKQMGTPIKEGVFVSGNVNTNGTSDGDANLSIPISGPNGSGTIHAVATKKNGKWIYSELDVDLDNGSSGPINLLADDNPSKAVEVDK